MALGWPEQAERHPLGSKRQRGYHRWLKKARARKMRREARRDPEMAPQKPLSRGYEY